MTELFKYFRDAAPIPPTTNIHYGFDVNETPDLPENIRNLSNQFSDDIRNIININPNIENYVDLWINNGSYNFQVLQKFKLTDILDNTGEEDIYIPYYLEPGLIDLHNDVVIGDYDLYMGSITDFLGGHLITALQNLPF